jgi:hypothetical protein
MSSREPEDFKIVDKRSSAGNREDAPKKEEPTKNEGPGFVMKDSEAAAPQQIDFSTLVFSLATGAIIHLGLAPDPHTKKVQKNTELARQNIEILSMLKEKTKGNLTADESTLLENLLTEVRLKYVQVTKS